MRSGSTPGRVRRLEWSLFVAALLLFVLRGWYLLLKTHEAYIAKDQGRGRELPFQGKYFTWGGVSHTSVSSPKEDLLALEDQEEDENLVVPTKLWVDLLKSKQDLVITRDRIVGGPPRADVGVADGSLPEAAIRGKVLRLKLPEPRRVSQAERHIALEGEFLSGMFHKRVNESAYVQCFLVHVNE
eukprot:1195264-Prorocentrum_minimum.AAC.6